MNTKPTDAIEQLRNHQTQLDADGCEVGVSRQAIDEVLAYIDGNATPATSDGYHTFDELYEHRHTLFIFVCRSNPGLSWRSKLHDDGTMMDGWFIAGVNTPKGYATYHMPLSHWDSMEGVKILDNAPKWDGHTSDDVLERIAGIPIARADEFTTLKMKNIQLINLLGDIINEATLNPSRLTSFNSPVLQLAVMEVYEHNNPDQPVDDRSRQIFQQMALVAYNG